MLCFDLTSVLLRLCRYCAQRLKRIRKCLKFTQGRRSHTNKKLESENVKDVRFLHIPLVLAERAWAYFMQLKEESKTEERKKFHMVRDFSPPSIKMGGDDDGVFYLSFFLWCVCVTSCLLSV